MTQQNGLQQRVFDLMKDDGYKPMTVSEIEDVFELEHADEFRELVKTLVKMEAQGHIVRSCSNRYGLPERMNLLRAMFYRKCKRLWLCCTRRRGHG